jgi:hypothetical protein
MMKKQIAACLLAIVCVLTLLPTRAYAAGDYVHIVSITPDAYANFKDDVTFTVTVNYTLQSVDSGIVYLGFNINEPGRYHLEDEAIVSKGSGTVTLTATVTPVGWGTPDSPNGALKGGMELLNGDTFKAYVNLSENPHPDSWNPLASEVLPLKKGTPSNTATAIAQTTDFSIFANLPEYFSFASGAGGWSTGVHINADGTFTGDYHDSDMGDTGDGYPGGTLYLCNFSGKFKDVKKISDLEYSMRIDWLRVDEPTGEPYIDDVYDIGYPIRVIPSSPYGFDSADEFRLYLPGKKTADLPQEYINWVGNPMAWGNNIPPTLPFYGLYNVGGQEGFFSSTDSSSVNPSEIRELTLNYKPDYDEGAVTVRWGDSLFEQPSTVYNHDLALVAAAMNAAASGNAEYLHGKNELVGAYEGVYSHLGFSNDKYYNYSVSYATTLRGSKSDEHCFSIASKEITVNGEKELLVAVVLRGTESINEGIGDAAAKKADRDYYGFDYKVYDYFCDYADKVWAQFGAYVSQDWTLKYDNIKVLISGHSLGGAAANLFAARFQLDDRQNITDPSNVYAYTFGALNTVEKAAGNPISGFGYIYNFFNHYDTFGPSGDGSEWFGVKPARGGITTKEKFGNVLVFSKDYKKVFTKGDTRYKNHNMPGYIDAIRSNQPTEKGNRVAILCPVDVDIYDSSGQIVGRTRNNIVDESVTSVPLYVDYGAKYILLPSDALYSLTFTAFDEGEMSYYVESVGHADEIGTVQTSFENVALTLGKTLSSQVGVETGSSLFVLDGAGVTIAEVQPDGTEIQTAAAVTPTTAPQTSTPTSVSAAEPDNPAFPPILKIALIWLVVAVVCAGAITVGLLIRKKKRSADSKETNNHNGGKK